MNIEDIISNKDSKEELSNSYDKVYLEMEELKDQLHLINSLNFEKELSSLVEEHNLQDKKLVLYKESNPSEEITTSGWWSLNVEVADPETDDVCIEDSLYYEFLSLTRKFGTYQFEHHINESFNEGETFSMILNDTKKVFEFLLPERVLCQYNAISLANSLNNNEKSSTRKPKL